jgi:predicted metal-dependent peptidase
VNNKLSPNEYLSQVIIKMVKQHSFYAHLIQNMNRQWSLDLPTIGVNVTDTVNLFINPHFLMNLSIDEAVDVLKHECMHVVNAHFVRFKELEPSIFEQTNEEKNKGLTPGDIVVKRIKDQSKFSILNKAGDFAINEYLPNIPKKMKFFDKEGNAIKDKEGKVIEGEPCLVSHHKDWDRQKNLEYYYGKMKQEQKQQSKGQGQGKGQPGDQEGNGSGGPNEVTIDDHGLWAENNPDNEYVLEKVKAAVNKAAEAAGGIGNLPGDLQAQIAALGHKPRDWRNELQQFVARTSEVLIDSTRKIRNRRYGILYPGSKTFPKLKLAVLWDVSGSMWSDELFGQILAEMNKIYSQGAEIVSIMFDTQVTSVEEYNPKMKLKPKGGGGTMYGPAFKEVEEHEVDAIIVFGDLDMADKPAKPKLPVLWGRINSKTLPPAKWGKIIDIEVKKKNVG